jgi:hypothetical protein
MPKRKRVDQITYEQRVTMILGLIARGIPSKRLVQSVAAQWDVTERQGWGYLRTARNRLEVLAEHKRQHLLEEMLGRHDDLREKGYSGGDLKLVLDTDKEDAKLLGLYAPEKHDFDIHGIDGAIESELARLVALAKDGDAQTSEGTE